MEYTCTLEVKIGKTWKTVFSQKKVKEKDIVDMLDYFRIVGERHYSRHGKIRVRHF
jgi:hypothetical protein